MIARRSDARWLGAAIVGAVLGLLLAGPARAEPEPDAAVAAPAATELVERLGDPRYAERRDARRRLLDRGLDAFDAVRRGRDHPDPEVADACARLLGDLSDAWVLLDASSEARELLTRFGRSASAERQGLVKLLAAMLDAGLGPTLSRRTGIGSIEQPARAAAMLAAKNEASVEALARLARFASSDREARLAAAALLAGDELNDLPLRRQRVIDATRRLADGYGAGERPAARWLADLADTAEDASPADRVDAWRRHVRSENDALLAQRPDADEIVVRTLAWHWLREALWAGDDAAALEAHATLVEASPEKPLVATIRSLLWAADAGRGAVVDDLFDSAGDRLEDKWGLYVRARVASRLGDEQRAEELAEAALAAEVDVDAEVMSKVTNPYMWVAQELRSDGHSDWARNEYARLGADLSDLRAEAVAARWRLADLHFDAARYDESAAELQELLQQIAPASAKRRYQSVRKQNRGLNLPSRETVIARQRLAAAHAATAVGDHEAVVPHLLAALKADPRDADLLIALYRAQSITPKVAAQIRRHAEKMRRAFEDNIAENPLDADALNGWAWLVSNTEGDFAKAIRYSRRSLALFPETAGYLDTLGRCYFAAGELEEAVAVQRRAVDLAPHVRVLRRQLTEFETALAAERSPAEGP